MLAKSPPNAACAVTSLPVVHVRDGEVYASSKDVAAYFGKEHAKVLLSIDSIVTHAPNLAIVTHAPNLACVWFQPFSCPHPTVPNREDRYFLMTKDGLALLVMGYTGKKAMGFKVAYILRFNEMGRELRERPIGLLPV